MVAPLWLLEFGSRPLNGLVTVPVSVLITAASRVGSVLRIAAGSVQLRHR